MFFQTFKIYLPKFLFFLNLTIYIICHNVTGDFYFFELFEKKRQREIQVIWVWIMEQTFSFCVFV